MTNVVPWTTKGPTRVRAWPGSTTTGLGTARSVRTDDPTSVLRVAEQRFVRADEVLWRDSGHVLVLARVDGYAVTLTGPGGAVWDVFERPRTLDEASAALAAVFGVDADVVRGDLEPLLARLVDEGFVRTVG